MKRTALFAVSTLVLAAVCLALWTTNQSARRELAALKVQTPAPSASADPKITRLQEENNRLRHDLGDMEMDLANTQAASNRLMLAQQASNHLPNVKTGAKGMTGFLKEMMDDPEMRKSLMQQQKMGLEMVYGPMIKELGLSPAEADQFKTLLVSKQMEMMSLAGDKANGLTPENQKKIADQQKDLDLQIKDLLGDKRFAQYKDYNETIGERTALNQFATQNSSITPDQKEQLLGIIKEEKKRGSGAESAPVDPSIEGLKAIQSDDAMEKMLQQQTDLNTRVLERSRDLLSPEQLDQLAAFQTNQINMQRMGIKMARKMMAPDDATAPAQKQ